VPEAARAFAVLAVIAAAASCRRDPGSAGSRAESPPASASAPAPSASAAPTVAAPLAGERVDVPGGAFRAGSVPGEQGRKPEIEERLTSVELGPYRIDRLPYPNDPAEPPRVNVTRDEAERLCAEKGTRLCTELEWERACKGPASSLFAMGATWDARCPREPLRCASGFDVLGLGALREWTSSDVVPEGDGARKPAVRGAPPDGAPAVHRCAARSSESADQKSEVLGFRCCKGARNAALVEEPRAGATFVQTQLTPARLSALLQADPKTARLAKDARFFREPDAAETVVSRGPGDKKGFFFTALPLLWKPVAGAEFLVVTGRAADNTSFVAVFHALGKNEYLLASSFIMENEAGPVALAYNGYIRPRLHFSTCWGCPGETGKILYRDPDSAVIVQP
jgi:hypothetical protein